MAADYRIRPADHFNMTTDHRNIRSTDCNMAVDRRNIRLSDRNNMAAEDKYQGLINMATDH